MTIQESTQLISKGASLKLVVDMLRQSEEDKTLLLEALEKIRQNKCYCYYHGYEAECPHEVARAAIEEVKS